MTGLRMTDPRQLSLKIWLEKTMLMKSSQKEDRIDENEVIAKFIENETKQDHPRNISKYDPSLDLPIA